MNDKQNNTQELNNQIILAQLCEDDTKVLEMLLEARKNGATCGPLPPEVSDASIRISKAKSLLSLLDEYNTAAIDDSNSENAAANDKNNDLAKRTIKYINDAKRREYFAENGSIARTRGFSFRWREAITGAAILLIGTSLLLPVLSSTRAQSLRQACMANLASVGTSIVSYASDHQNTLPKRESAKQGSLWWNIGNPAHSNSAQLYKLVKDGYATAEDLACPGNEYATTNMSPQEDDWPSHKAVSYSYQNQFTNTPIHIDKAPHMAVLADKNPLILNRMGQMMLDMQLPSNSPSTNHAESGQNVLKIDGSVTWENRPTVQTASGKDNIWLMNGVSNYNGTESPVGHDSFLVP